MQIKTFLVVVPLAMVVTNTAMAYSVKSVVTKGLSGTSLSLQLMTIPGSPPPSTSVQNSTGSGSGNVLNDVHSAVCDGVTFTSGDGVNVQQGSGTTSVNVTNWGKFTQIHPSVANKLSHAPTFSSGGVLIHNINPTPSNNCEFTVQQPIISNVKTSWSVQLDTTWNRLGTPTSRKNSILNDMYTGYTNGPTNVQYCPSSLPVSLMNPNSQSSVTKVNSNTWVVSGSSFNTSYANISFGCAGIYKITELINGSYALSYNHVVSPNNFPWSEKIPTPKPQKSTTTVTGQSGYGNLVIIK